MLNSEFVLSRLGATAMETVNEYRLLSWLGMQEDIHRMVIYQVSRGTRFAICYRRPSLPYYSDVGSMHGHNDDPLSLSLSLSPSLPAIPVRQSHDSMDSAVHSSSGLSFGRGQRQS